MDGRVVDGILTGPLAGPTIGGARAQVGSYAFSEEEEKLVIDNLQRLGYT
jgi:hypothetical protein